MYSGIILFRITIQNTNIFGGDSCYIHRFIQIKTWVNNIKMIETKVQLKYY